MTNVTEHIWCEKALQVSEMRWQFAVESHGDAMWDWDATKDVLFLTAAARELFDLPETGSERPIADLIARVLDEDRAFVQAQLDDIIGGKTSEWLGEWRLALPGRTPRWVVTRGRVMTRAADGHRSASSVSTMTPPRENFKRPKSNDRENLLHSKDGWCFLVNWLRPLPTKSTSH